MSAIIKIGFNVIYKRHETDRDGGKPMRFIFFTQGDGSEDSPHEIKHAAIKTGTSDDSATIGADDVEQAIKLIRERVIGKKCYWQMDEGDKDLKIKKDQWMCDVVHSIQIVRAEPVAFTTL